jgi:hypothetical protein
MVGKIHIAADSTIVLMIVRYCEVGPFMCIPIDIIALRVLTSFDVTMIARSVLRTIVHPIKRFRLRMSLMVSVRAERTFRIIPVTNEGQHSNRNASNKCAVDSPIRAKYKHAGTIIGNSFQLKRTPVRYI